MKANVPPIEPMGRTFLPFLPVLQLDLCSHQILFIVMFKSETKLLENVLHGLIIHSQDSGETVDILALGNIHHTTDQFTADTCALIGVTDHDAQFRILTPPDLCQTSNTQNAARAILVDPFGNQRNIAIVVTMADAGQALMQDAIL